MSRQCQRHETCYVGSTDPGQCRQTHAKAVMKCWELIVALLLAWWMLVAMRMFANLGLEETSDTKLLLHTIEELDILYTKYSELQ